VNTDDFASYWSADQNSVRNQEHRKIDRIPLTDRQRQLSHRRPVPTSITATNGSLSASRDSEGAAWSAADLLPIELEVKTKQSKINL
jgi:hypothetical protein